MAQPYDDTGQQHGHMQRGLNRVSLNLHTLSPAWLCRQQQAPGLLKKKGTTTQRHRSFS